MPHADALCEVRLFGHVCVTNKEGERIHLPRKALELLFWIVAHESGCSDRFRVISDLWPHEDDAVAYKSLRNHLYILRKALKDAGIPDPVISDGDGLILRNEIVGSDWQRFTALIREAELAGYAEKLRIYMLAFDSVSGPPSGGFGWAWLEPLRLEARHALVEALRRSLDLAGTQNESGTRLRLVEAGLRFLPEDDAIAEEWIEHLLGIGRIDDARFAFDRLAKCLSNDGALPRKPWTDYALPSTRAEIPRPLQLPETARVAHRGPFWILAIGGIAAILSCVLAFVVLRQPRWKPPSSIEEAELRLAVMRSETGAFSTSPDAEFERSRIVCHLCDSAWQAMWTSKETSYVELFKRIDGDIREAFRWSLDHRPEMAVEIAGNGHRILYLSQTDRAWASWLPWSLKAGRSASPLYRARALCGTALADWKGDAPMGHEAALEAVAIFKSLRRPWDEANAWRHVGVCDAAHYARQTREYLHALFMFQSLHDARGIGMTEQSLAERGNPPGGKGREVCEEYANWELRAASEFRRSGDERLIKESIFSAYNELHAVYFQGDASRKLWRQVRGALQTLLNPASGRQSADNNIEVLRRCLQIDEDLKDEALFAGDLRHILLQVEYKPVQASVHAYLSGLMQHFKRESVVSSPGTSYELTEKDVRPSLRRDFIRGESACLSDARKAADRLDVVDAPP